MIDVSTLILKEEDLIDPTKNKRADIDLAAFQSYVRPLSDGALLVLYLSPKGGYIVLQDKRNLLESYVV